MHHLKEHINQDIKMVSSEDKDSTVLERNVHLLHIYSTTKETHQSLFRAIMAKYLRHENIFYTIFFSNQLCIKLLKNVTVFLKLVHAVRQCIDKGSFLKMTGFRKLVFTQVLAYISSIRPITSMYLSDEANKCLQKLKQNLVSLVSPDLNTIEQLFDEFWRGIQDRSVQPRNL